MTQKIKKLTTSEAAKMLGVSNVRIRQMIDAGIIPAERVGKFFVLRDCDVKKARGRKGGRPRKHPLKVQAVPIETDEQRRIRLAEEMRQRLEQNRAEREVQNAESAIYGYPQVPPSQQYVPRPFKQGDPARSRLGGGGQRPTSSDYIEFEELLRHPIIQRDDEPYIDPILETDLPDY